MFSAGAPRFPALLATMAEGTMFCTGHTSMNINELVSYSALIKKEFVEEYMSEDAMDAGVDVKVESEHSNANRATP